jgi:hypothetical protein
MGLWLYRIDATPRHSGRLVDQTFDEFSHAFEHVRERPEVPNIFED